MTVFKYVFVYALSVLSGVALGNYLWYNPHPIQGHVYKKLAFIHTQDDKVLVLKSMTGKIFTYDLTNEKNVDYYVMDKELKPLIEQESIFK